jgi:hypothetical protein
LCGYSRGQVAVCMLEPVGYFRIYLGSDALIDWAVLWPMRYLSHKEQSCFADTAVTLALF